MLCDGGVIDDGESGSLLVIHQLVLLLYVYSDIPQIYDACDCFRLLVFKFFVFTVFTAVL